MDEQRIREVVREELAAVLEAAGSAALVSDHLDTTTKFIKKTFSLDGEYAPVGDKPQLLKST